MLTRHALSTLNEEGRINGDPSVPVPITEQGRAEAEQVGHRLAQVSLELCVHTRFARTRETADAMLLGRDVPRLVEPLLDDIDVGELEIPVRYALNAAAGSDDLDGPEHRIPNATPYLFDADTLSRAAARIEQLVPSEESPFRGEG